MNKFMNFAEQTRNAFENDVAKFEGFKTLCVDAGKGTQLDFSAQEASQAIKEKFMEVIGCDEHSTKREIRRAIKAHQQELFAISEEIIPDLLISGWQENPFFKEYAEIKNLAIGDTN